MRHADVPRTPIRPADREVGEDLLDDHRLRKPGKRATTRAQRSVLAEVDHLVHETTDLFGLRLSGLHALIAKHREGQVAEHSAPRAGASPELSLVNLMRH